MELSLSSSGSGSGKRKCKRSSVRRSLEYPCVSRLRHRRLLAFLRHHNFHSTFEALVQETDVLFFVPHLQFLVMQGRWSDAIKYVFRFAPYPDMFGQEFRVFFSFLHVHRDLEFIAAGHSRGAVVARWYEIELKEHPSSSGSAKLARMLLAFHRSEQLSLRQLAAGEAQGRQDGQGLDRADS